MEGQIYSNCDQSPLNTGIDKCWSFDKSPKGIILTDSDFYIPSGQNVSDYLKNAALYIEGSSGNVTDKLKVYPLMEGLVNLEVSGGDTRTAQEGFGPNVPIGFNAYQETYTYTSGGVCLYKEISKLNGKEARVFFVDIDNVCFGVSDSDGNTRGFNVSCSTQYRRNTGTVVGGFLISLYYTLSREKEMQNATSFVIDDILGMREFTWINHVKVGTDTIGFQIISSCSGANLSSFFYDNMDAADIEAYNASTGDSVSRGQVLGYDSDSKILTVRFFHPDPAPANTIFRFNVTTGKTLNFLRSNRLTKNTEDVTLNGFWL